MSANFTDCNESELVGLLEQLNNWLHWQPHSHSTRL